MNNVFLALPLPCMVGASRCKGPGENKFSTKRISWSDWKICFRPVPLAETETETETETKRKPNAGHD